MELGELGHSHELPAGVLGVHRLLLALLPPGQSPGQLADHGDDLTGLVGGVELEVGRPGGSQGEARLQQAEAEEEAGAGQERRRSPGEVVLQEGDLNEILNTTVSQSLLITRQTYLSQSVLLNINISCLGVPSQEVKGERSGEVKAESVEDLQLHLPNFPSSVGIVSDVDKVVDLGSIP